MKNKNILFIILSIVIILVTMVIIKEVIPTINEKNYKTRMLLQVHDELIFNVLNDELDKVKTIVKQIMENTIKLSVPLEVDIECGANWYEAK